MPKTPAVKRAAPKKTTAVPYSKRKKGTVIQKPELLDALRNEKDKARHPSAGGVSAGRCVCGAQSAQAVKDIV